VRQLLLPRHCHRQTRRVRRAAEIVNHDACSAAGKFECVRFTEAVAGTGNDHNLIVKSYAQYLVLFCLLNVTGE